MVRFRGCLKRLGSNLTEGGVPWSGDGTQMTSVIWEVVMRVNKSTPMPFTLTDPRRTFLISTHWKPQALAVVLSHGFLCMEGSHRLSQGLLPGIAFLGNLWGQSSVV